MKPIDIVDNGTEAKKVVFAKDQPQYMPLPALVYPNGCVVTEWEFTPEERLQIAAGENLVLTLLTFGNPLQPVRLQLTPRDC